ncbi:MAG: DEAD/DEAH box helicase, partial [Deltaproteobacteria bacterium]|nr:DEAD/DEAH box helicase [Deltaproteobacteria bacterium]
SLFQRRYQKPIEDANDLEALGRLKKRLHPFIMRRQKEDVAPELPPKTEIDQYCEMTPSQRKIYEQILNSSRKTLFKEVEQKGIEKSHLSILTALLRLRQVCCHPHLVSKADATSEEISGKFELFQQLLQEIISEGHRVVVFSQFVEMLKLLKGWLESQSIRFEYLDGRTRKRQDHIKNFQSDSSIPVFLISLKAGGTGLNLSEADYVIHYDPWWNPAVQDQATDRVHRIGQKQHVFAYKLITKDSVEEKILSLQGRKRDLFKGVLSADSAFGKKLSYEDLEYLFS